MKSKPARVTALVLIASVLLVTLLLTGTPSSAQILQQAISQQPPEVQLVRDLGIEVVTLFEQEGVSFLFSTHLTTPVNHPGGVILLTTPEVEYSPCPSVALAKEEDTSGRN